MWPQPVNLPCAPSGHSKRQSRHNKRPRQRQYADHQDLSCSQRPLLTRATLQQGIYKAKHHHERVKKSKHNHSLLQQPMSANNFIAERPPLQPTPVHGKTDSISAEAKQTDSAPPRVVSTSGRIGVVLITPKAVLRSKNRVRRNDPASPRLPTLPRRTGSLLSCTLLGVP